MISGEIWRLGRRPELDGLRGIAILLVLATHLDQEQVTGAGAIGVTVFFTLSGFLITSLMLEEHSDTGRVHLPAFYRRRALRLLPVVVAAVLTVAVLDLVVETGVSIGGALATVFYGSNYYAMTHPGITWLSHTWTLALEEQFYLLWPLALIVSVRWGRRAVFYTGLVGSVASLLDRALMQAVGVDRARIGFGFDTRCDALLVGCALAAWLHGRPAGVSKPTAAALALVGLLPLAWGSPNALLVIPYVVPAVTAAVIWWLVAGDGVAWIRAGWLQLVGRRSYGLYVWHFIVIEAAWPLVHELPWLVRSGVLAALAWTAALASWRWVESPFLRRKGDSGLRIDRLDERVSRRASRG